PLDVVRGGIVEPACSGVFDDFVDRVLGVLLVGSDNAGRGALDPARYILARQMDATFVGHPSAIVSDETAAIVKGDAGDRLPGITNRAKYELSRDLVEPARAARCKRAVFARDNLVVLD